MKAEILEMIILAFQTFGELLPLSKNSVIIVTILNDWGDP